MHAYWTIVLLVLVTPVVQAQTATLRGFITDETNGEPLQGVNVILDNATGAFYGAATNGDGVYVLSRIPVGRYRFRVSFIGYESIVDTLDLRPDELRLNNLSLRTSQAELNEVVVETERESGAARLTAGMQSIRPQDIEIVPSPDVSGDLASLLTTLPGVVALGDRGGQLFIRGGEPAHNMFLLDGMYVHQPFHLLGFYSAFPSEMISRADVHAAGYGSPFSGRIASVIDVYSRDGNKRAYAGSASIAPFISAAHLEGPLVRDRISFLASIRQSVIEQGAQQYVDQDLPYNFGDAFAKMHFVINRNHRISITGLYTHDRGRLGQPSEDTVLDEIRWSNSGIGLRYVFLPKRVPFVGEILISGSRLETSTGAQDNPVREAQFDGFNYAVNMTNFIGNHEWKWGLFWRAPEISALLGGTFQNVEFSFSRRHKAGLYIEPNFRIGESLRLRAGLIQQLFPGQEQKVILEPRLQIIWNKGVHEISAATGLYHQEIFGLNDRRDATNVFTAWRSAPVDVLSKAVHTLIGYRANPVPQLEFSIEGYYKRLTNLHVAEWTAFPRFTTRLQRANGIAMGLDLRMEFRSALFYGYINYGLSSVEYEALQTSLPLWYGEESLSFRPPHDRRHQVNILANTSVQDFNISVRWNFGSGRPFNRVFGFDGFVLMHGLQDLFQVSDEQRVIYERPFRGILPTYHRLDLSVERLFDFRNLDLTVQGSIINVYNRRNLFALDLFTLRRTDQLPFIPTLGLKVAF